MVEQRVTIHHSPKTRQPVSPQFSENLVIEIYVEADDLLKAFENWSQQKAVGKLRLPTRTPSLSPSAIATILIAYHHSSYKCFEYYYKECILGRFHGCFPKAPC